MSGYPVIEHGVPPQGRIRRWVGENRLRIALALGVIEIVAIVFTDFTKWSALLVAAAIFVVYLWSGRGHRSWAVRQTTWILAASQILPVVFAILGYFLAVLAVVAVVAMLGIVLLMLFLDRR
jgi:hypothetical protein